MGRRTIIAVLNISYCVLLGFKLPVTLASYLQSLVVNRYVR